MGKKKFTGVSQFLARFRGWIQAGAALLTNLHLPNFLKGGLYQGAGKTVCVPGLNCYSCPAASGACPIGAFQAVVGSSKFSFSYYITGILILLGVLLGRFICGFLCPFGWFQELLHKIPSRRPLLLQVSLPTGRAGGGNSAVSCQFRHPCGAGQPVYVEVRHFTGGDRAQRAVLSALLQVDLPAGRVLCAAE